MIWGSGFNAHDYSGGICLRDLKKNRCWGARFCQDWTGRMEHIPKPIGRYRPAIYGPRQWGARRSGAGALAAGGRGRLVRGAIPQNGPDPLPAKNRAGIRRVIRRFFTHFTSPSWAETPHFGPPGTKNEQAVSHNMGVSKPASGKPIPGGALIFAGTGRMLNILF